MGDPLVSVMLPCHNAAATLPAALASLVAQEYERWECVLVDDGSEDRPDRVVERFGDPRIRVVRLARNRGRPVARQVALDRVRGPLLAFLDADDWIYPSKLRRQVAFMTAHPDVAAVGVGMAVTGRSGDITGVRGRGQPRHDAVVREPWTRLAPPPIAPVTAMLRIDGATEASYDPRLIRGQDTDFLLQVVLDRPFATLYGLGYAYAEHDSFARDKAITGLRCEQLMYGKRFRRAPLQAMRRMAAAEAKLWTYRAGFLLGMDDYLVRRRSAAPDPGDLAGFEAARSAVDRVRLGAMAREA